MEPWWIPPLRNVIAGRRVVLAGGPAATWSEHVGLLRSAGAADLMVIATNGVGAGAAPDVPTVVAAAPVGLGATEQIHLGNEILRDPPDHVVRALDDFDPDGDALVIGTFLNSTPSLAGRAFLAHRRPEWVALEDKTVVDAFWDRAGIDRQPSEVVDVRDAADTWARLDLGAGTVWAADARDGFHGGASKTHRVLDDTSARRVQETLAAVCDTVRIMPFLEGVPCSIHGMVLPDAVAVFRPVEMVTLRSARGFVYAGCATFWDPPDEIREAMRQTAQLAGRLLATEVGFRGVYTVDGVVAADGFWPTELNPRFGAGMNVIARASGLPVLLVSEMAAGGHDIGRSAAEVETEVVEAADRSRGGGTWIHGFAGVPEFVERGATLGDDGWSWASHDGAVTASVTTGSGFVRCTYHPAAVSAGPSTAPLATRFWAFADREFGLGLGPLTTADVTA